MRKLSVLFPLFVALIFISFLPGQMNGQGNSGTNPEFVFYKYYSGVGGIQPVNTLGDSLGTLRWRGMVATSPSIWHEGPSITARITGPVNATTMPASLIFRTGPTTALDRMAITSDGLVGIGTLNPLFNLHTVGNTHTTGDFYGRIHFDDNQGTDDAPDTYIDEAYFELKQRSVLGLPAGLGTHGGLFSVAPGANSFDHQIFFAEDGLFTRRWDGNANSWAGSMWYKILTGEDIMGTPNRIAKFTGPNSLGDSQLWDDGAQVGIGTDSPTTGFFLDINGLTRINGNTTLTQDLSVNNNTVLGGTLNVGNNASLGGTLTVTGSSTLNGLTTINANADINGALNVSGNTTLGNTLSVSGPATLNGFTTINDNADINGTLDVSGSGSFGNNITVGSNANIGGNLDVMGTGHFDGKVSIGTDNTPTSLGGGGNELEDYNLYVEGGILTEELRVRTGWADYVFAPEYNLPTLNQVEEYINNHGHLPNTPTTAEVEKNGLELGQMLSFNKKKLRNYFFI